MRQTFYSRIGKRVFDLALAAAGLIFISPLLVAVGLAVRLTSRGPAFFRQIRVGQFGRPFRIFKFRTMKLREGERGSLLTAAGDSRITTVGGWLRKTKLDELPQLINVLLGDMSLVGPRPEVPEFVAAFGNKKAIILLAKPGITGASANVYEEELLASQPDKEAFYLTTVLPAKLKIDVSYCSDIRLKTDLRLLIGTIAALSTRIVEVCRPLRLKLAGRR